MSNNEKIRNNDCDETVIHFCFVLVNYIAMRVSNLRFDDTVAQGDDVSGE